MYVNKITLTPIYIKQWLVPCWKFVNKITAIAVWREEEKSALHVNEDCVIFHEALVPGGPLIDVIVLVSPIYLSTHS